MINDICPFPWEKKTSCSTPCPFSSVPLQVGATRLVLARFITYRLPPPPGKDIEAVPYYCIEKCGSYDCRWLGVGSVVLTVSDIVCLFTRCFGRENNMALILGVTSSCCRQRAFVRGDPFHLRARGSGKRGRAPVAFIKEDGLPFFFSHLDPPRVRRILSWPPLVARHALLVIPPYPQGTGILRTLHLEVSPPSFSPYDRGSSSIVFLF